MGWFFYILTIAFAIAAIRAVFVCVMAEKGNHHAMFAVGVMVAAMASVSAVACYITAQVPPPHNNPTLMIWTAADILYAGTANAVVSYFAQKLKQEWVE